jgi:hypothetical protein
MLAEDKTMMTFAREVSSRGGISRAKSLTSERRREIASKAGKARWANKPVDWRSALQAVRGVAARAFGEGSTNVRRLDSLAADLTEKGE